MLAEALQPFLPLPLELKAEILSHADTDTLARACSVSLAFLQLAAALLYRDITFNGSRGLEKFLSLRADVQVPELAPNLDLSLVQSITYIEDKEEPFKFKVILDQNAYDDTPVKQRVGCIVPCRLFAPNTTSPTITPLALHSLCVELWSETICGDVWRLFDPVLVRIEGCVYVDDEDLDNEVLTITGPNLSLWSRLREITYKDTISDDVTFAPVTKMPKTGPIALTFDLSVDCLNMDQIRWLCTDARGPESDAAAVIEAVHIAVGTDELRRVILEDLIDSPLLDRTTVVIKPFDPFE